MNKSQNFEVKKNLSGRKKEERKKKERKKMKEGTRVASNERRLIKDMLHTNKNSNNHNELISYFLRVQK